MTMPFNHSLQRRQFIIGAGALAASTALTPAPALAKIKHKPLDPVNPDILFCTNPSTSSTPTRFHSPSTTTSPSAGISCCLWNAITSRSIWADVLKAVRLTTN